MTKGVKGPKTTTQPGSTWHSDIPAVMDGWSFVYEGFDPVQEGLREALCTLGNGYFATRGAAPESSANDVHYPGTYVAGCYDRLVTEVEGRSVENEDLVNVPNWLPLKVRVVGEEWFDLDAVELLDFRQELDLRQGVLRRRLRFRDVAGRVTRVTEGRLVSMGAPHLAAIQLSLVPENWSGRIEIRSALDGTVTNSGVGRYRNLQGDHLVPVEAGEVSEECIYLQVRTRQSDIQIAEAARTRLLRGGVIPRHRRRLEVEAAHVAHELTIDVEEGEALEIEKVAALYTTRDHAISEPGLEARAAVQRARDFGGLLQRQELSWKHLWERFDLEIEGHQRAQGILRLHLFHLLQTVSANTIGLDVGVPARGLHGEAYRGHIFWDELFILPFLDFHLPALSGAVLQYRRRRLPQARWTAEEEGYAGAMFPWQSGSNGREESQILHLNPRSGRWLPDNSRLQRHIGIAVAFNAWHHYEVTPDPFYLRFLGGPLIIEIARFLASMCSYNAGLDRYEIKGVMGPDEYHDAYPDAGRPGLDNNAYTNLMTVWVLYRARAILELLSPHHRQELWELLSLSREEVSRWEDISHKMRVVFHDDRIISQFEGYGDLEEFDWSDYVSRYGDIHRLDRILESEGDSSNRYKVSKQADLLMLFYLLPADELQQIMTSLGYSFDPESDIPRNVEYYLQRTSHGSTLSRVVHSWLLARFDRKRSWDLFLQALESDVGDIQGGTTHEGIHLGAMAGTVDLVQRCFGGLEARRDVLWFNPALPEELSGLRFSIHYRGHRVKVNITHNRLLVESLPMLLPPIRVGFRDEIVQLRAGGRKEWPLS